MVLEKDKNHHHTLVNDSLSIDKGTTEVDCIHISESGIFVIESKNYSGAIYGHSRRKM